MAGGVTDSHDLQTSGWAERTLLQAVAIRGDDGITSRAAGMQDVHDRLVAVAQLTQSQPPDDESVYMTGNRAFHQLEEKGLVADVEDAQGLAADRYEVAPGYRPDDARRTEWVLTDEGFTEVRRLDERFKQELAALQRRFGRSDVWPDNVVSDGDPVTDRSTTNASHRGPIENWPREDWRPTTGAAVQDEIDRRGRADIARWRHTETGLVCAHVYRPSAEQPYLVEIRGPDIEPQKLGVFPTRHDGGTANKEFMRSHIHAQDLAEWLAENE